MLIFERKLMVTLISPVKRALKMTNLYVNPISSSVILKSNQLLIEFAAFNVFVAWVKVFKYLSFNKTMTQLSGTLSAVNIYSSKYIY